MDIFAQILILAFFGLCGYAVYKLNDPKNQFKS